MPLLLIRNPDNSYSKTTDKLYTRYFSIADNILLFNGKGISNVFALCNINCIYCLYLFIIFMVPKILAASQMKYNKGQLVGVERLIKIDLAKDTEKLYFID